ncbi:MAG: hypothetical protein JNJ77_09920 [Planctomycetia bacterium]|nr:hypothetical protein [Planctomycetia bacterium]
MSSRWLHLGLLVVVVIPGQWVLAQSPRSDRDSGLLPPVVQVVAREPMDEVEVVVELIKEMPRTREEQKPKQELPENFKVIKVKRDKTDEPTSIVSHETTKTEVSKTVEKKPVVTKVPVEAKSKEEPLHFVPIEKQKAVNTTPTVAMEPQPRLVKVPVREHASYEMTLPDLAVPEPWSPQVALQNGEICTSCVPTLADSNIGWIDSAIPGTNVRLRFDGRWRNRYPDRAEFFTARSKQYFDGTNIDGRGFEVPESNIDMIEAVPYVEWAFSQRASVFFEMPLRYMDPQENPAAFGGGDFNFGFKFAYFFMPEQVQTFQLRLIMPTGAEGRGLGTGHAVIEPSFLMWQRLSEKFVLESEFRNWIPVGGTNYSGYTLRYALGLSYDWYQGDNWSIKPVTELIGWSVLRGYQSDFIDSLPTFQTTGSAQGTIIEWAWGVRGTAYANCDWYLGYSFNVTDKSWFEDNIRLEMRWRF